MLKVFSWLNCKCTPIFKRSSRFHREGKVIQMDRVKKLTSLYLNQSVDTKVAINTYRYFKELPYHVDIEWFCFIRPLTDGAVASPCPARGNATRLKTIPVYKQMLYFHLQREIVILRYFLYEKFSRNYRFYKINEYISIYNTKLTL